MQLAEHLQLSERQREDVERFKGMFKDEESVLSFFAPVKWSGATRDAGNCLMCPTMTLRLLNLVYDSDDLAKGVVYNNLSGIYRMSGERERINEDVADMTADMFVSKYGAELSVFGALCYFAEYLTDWKSSYGRFDLQDVLRQCGKGYLPRWRDKVGRMEEAQKRNEERSEQVGKAAMWSYLRREYVEKGRSIKESALYMNGMMTEEEVRLIESGEELVI